MGSEILRTEKTYSRSKIDGKLTYLGSEILRAERKKVFVNELGSLKIWSTYLGSLKNLVNIFGGLQKWPDMITSVIKVNEFPAWVIKVVSYWPLTLPKTGMVCRSLCFITYHTQSVAFKSPKSKLH